MPVLASTAACSPGGPAAGEIPHTRMRVDGVPSSATAATWSLDGDTARWDTGDVNPRSDICSEPSLAAHTAEPVASPPVMTTRPPASATAQHTSDSVPTSVRRRRVRASNHAGTVGAALAGCAPERAGGAHGTSA